MTTERRSQATTAGDQRAPNRSMLRAMGFKDADFDKPLVGLASAHSTVTPCNMSLGPLAEYDLRNVFLRHLQKQTPNFFVHHRTGDLMSRATADIQSVSNFFQTGSIIFFDSALF